jgi:hypothetical protein
MDRNFEGTSLAAEHIGDKQSQNLSALASDANAEFCKLECTAGAEAANAITVAVQAKTLGGKNLAKSVRLHGRVYAATMIESLAAAATLGVAGEASLVTASAQASALIDLGSDGNGSIVVTDVSGALAGDLILELEPVDRGGVKTFLILTFA